MAFCDAPSVSGAVGATCRHLSMHSNASTTDEDEDDDDDDDDELSAATLHDTSHISTQFLPSQERHVHWFHGDSS